MNIRMSQTQAALQEMDLSESCDDGIVLRPGLRCELGLFFEDDLFKPRLQLRCGTNTREIQFHDGFSAPDILNRGQGGTLAYVRNEASVLVCQEDPTVSEVIVLVRLNHRTLEESFSVDGELNGLLPFFSFNYIDGEEPQVEVGEV